MSKPVVYFAAPVSPTPDEIARESGGGLHPAPVEAAIASNLARARRWIAWLVEHTDWSIAARPSARPRSRHRVSSSVSTYGIHDAIIMVGGRASKGMAIERNHAEKCGLRVISLMSLGDEPPSAVAPEYLDALRGSVHG